MPLDPRLIVFGSVATLLAATIFLRRHPASTVGMSDRAPTTNAMKKTFEDSEKTFDRIRNEGEKRAIEATNSAKKAVGKSIDTAEATLDKIRPAMLERSTTSSSFDPSPRSTIL